MYVVTRPFVPTPTGTFTYSGINVLKYSQIPGIFQEGRFELVADFNNQTGTITGSAVDADSASSRSEISGNIILNNMTGEFRTPDNENLEVMLIEPNDVSAPKTAGSRSINANIYGQFGEYNGNKGVSGIYVDQTNQLIYGAIVGGISTSE